jgi:hypothetical protein
MEPLINPHPDPGAAGDIVEARGGSHEQCQFLQISSVPETLAALAWQTWINVLAFIRIVAPFQPGEARLTSSDSE